MLKKLALLALVALSGISTTHAVPADFFKVKEEPAVFHPILESMPIALFNITPRAVHLLRTLPPLLFKAGLLMASSAKRIKKNNLSKSISSAAMVLRAYPEILKSFKHKTR